MFPYLTEQFFRLKNITKLYTRSPTNEAYVTKELGDGLAVGLGVRAPRNHPYGGTLATDSVFLPNPCISFVLPQATQLCFYFCERKSAPHQGTRTRYYKNIFSVDLR